MNPALAVKLRPTGPWRIGSDTGARNRVDVCFHSDALYSAVTSALARMGSIDEWLNATARAEMPPAVAFTSCFPFLDELDYVVPPRSIWPPVGPGASRVRWKSARFAPLSLVRSMLAGKRPDEGGWAVDGQSECLVPRGRPGPFRTSVRWSAAVDRLTGAAERHSIACLEFRPGAGLWTIVAFADEAARDRWQEPVKGAFRLLADSGFGGKRARGWGRSAPPEFIEAALPEMILPAVSAPPVVQAPDLRSESEPQSGAGLPVCLPEAEAATPPPPPTADAGAASASAEPESPPAASNEPDPEGGAGAFACQSPSEAIEPEPAQAEVSVQASPDIEPFIAAPSDPEGGAGVSDCQLPSEAEPEPVEAEASVQAPAEVEPFLATASEPPSEPDQSVEPSASETPVETEAAETAAAQDEIVAEPSVSPEPAMEAGAPPEPLASESSLQPPAAAPTGLQAGPTEPPAAPGFELAEPHWLLSLFSPAVADAVDWRRGNYALVARCGRVESSAGSGELKKHVQMVVEGSVLMALAPPLGAAPDVAPDGFAHPVYRAGFAVAIPLNGKAAPGPAPAPEAK